MDRPAYPSDLTDAQWKRIEPLIPKAKRGGRPRTTDMRRVIDAIFYLVRSGCAWRMLPRDFPAWSTVHDYYRKWRRCGVWRRIHDRLVAEVRKKHGRQVSPSAAILDSQSIKTTEKGGAVAAMTPARK